VIAQHFFWYALAAWIKGHAEDVIAFCLHTANILDEQRGNL
jgi:hypothetical protein